MDSTPSWNVSIRIALQLSFTWYAAMQSVLCFLVATDLLLSLPSLMMFGGVLCVMQCHIVLLCVLCLLLACDFTHYLTVT